MIMITLYDDQYYNDRNNVGNDNEVSDCFCKISCVFCPGATFCEIVTKTTIDIVDSMSLGNRGHCHKNYHRH